MNNNDAFTRGIWVDNDGSPNGTATSGYADWKNQVLVNVLNPSQTVTVANDGRVHLYAPARGYSVWVLQSEYTAVSGKQAVPPADEANVPVSYYGVKVFPNPSSSQTTIDFGVPTKSKVRLEVYDEAGRVVKVLANGIFYKGRYQQQFAYSVSGIYTYRYVCGEKVTTGRIVIQK